ncbi:MAG: glycogen debranching enzyme, partial [Rhodoluna sp.]|nr:glycogen debranching enzyme [Rhodoluna sp.]
MSSEMPAPGEMGVTVVDGIGTIRVYSENATSIQVVIFEPDEVTRVQHEIELDREGHIWTASSHHLRPGVNYALRADGPKEPRNAFNNQLFLIDPYARGVVRQNAREYHCVVIDDAFDWQGVTKPNIPLDELVIYEAHARGLTRGNPDLPDELRGTYAALGHPSTIAHLKKIGVNSVELLPI